MAKWLELQENNEYNDVVISSRIRLARNLGKFKFPSYISSEDANKVFNTFAEAINRIDKNKDFSLVSMNDLDLIDSNVLMEEHIISPELIKNRKISHYIINKNNLINLMINEEDHMRLQILLPELDLYKAYEMADELDRKLEKEVDFAFNSKFGYLTSCPTNTGTGMRASVMLVLPALQISNYIDGFKDSLGKLGITIRGVYGEGSEALGNMYQISNQKTLGFSEEEVIDKLDNIVLKVIEKERETRISLLNNKTDFIEDKIYRAFGILKYSRIISDREALSHLSFLRMGISLNLYNGLNFNQITDLMLSIQKNNILRYKKFLNSSESENALRANFIRDYFEKEEMINE